MTNPRSPTCPQFNHKNPCRELAAQYIERKTIMAINYAKLFNRRVTPQSQPIPGSTQVRNSGGGYLVAGG